MADERCQFFNIRVIHKLQKERSFLLRKIRFSRWTYRDSTHRGLFECQKLTFGLLVSN